MFCFVVLVPAKCSNCCVVYQGTGYKTSGQGSDTRTLRERGHSCINWSNTESNRVWRTTCKRFLTHTLCTDVCDFQTATQICDCVYLVTPQSELETIDELATAIASVRPRSCKEALILLKLLVPHDRHHHLPVYWWVITFSVWRKSNYSLLRCLRQKKPRFLLSLTFGNSLLLMVLGNALFTFSSSSLDYLYSFLYTL